MSKLVVFFFKRRLQFFSIVLIFKHFLIFYLNSISDSCGDRPPWVELPGRLQPVVHAPAGGPGGGEWGNALAPDHLLPHLLPARPELQQCPRPRERYDQASAQTETRKGYEERNKLEVNNKCS